MIYRLSLIALTFLIFALSALGQDAAKIYRFENGNWFNGKKFEKRTFYSVRGTLSDKRPASVDEVIDLKGGYVIPPFADAHTHNLDGPIGLDRMIKAYIGEGTFYVQVLANKVAGATEAKPKLNRFDTPDVVYANAMITRTYGHPFMVYEPIAMGIYNPAEGYRRVDEVKKSRLGLGQSYWFFDSKANVDANWEKVLATKPDLIKIGLLDASRKQEDPAKKGVDGGLSPEVAEYVVKKAHESYLRVFAHVETAEDFRIGLRIGIDGFAHLPYYGWDARNDLTDDLTENDIRMAGKKKVVVVPTAGRGRFSYTEYTPDGKQTVDEARKTRVVSRQKRILNQMLKAGVTIALGYDSFGSTLLPEISYLAENQIFDNATLLFVATEMTPRSIFRTRQIGRLKNGYEASFLVLGADPIADMKAVKDIRYRFKQGRFIGK